MKGYIPKIGEEINELTIEEIYLKPSGNQNKRFAKCLCSCGNTCEHRLTEIIQGKRKDCGCVKRKKARERTIKRNYKHGKSYHPLMNIWGGILTRCTNPKVNNYHNYGGRGIKVCDEWKEYINFYNWAIENGWKEGLTIDRINNDGDYSSENCRIITQKEQCYNSRHNHLITLFGETKTLFEWLEDERCKIKHHTTYLSRIKAGWSIEESITKPARKLNC